MVIEIKMTNDQVMVINQTLQQLYAVSPKSSGDGKVWLSIGLELADSFDTKAKKAIKTHGIFDVKKKKKITLKYYQAYALERLLVVMIQHLRTPYELNCVQLVIAQLNQKLA